ncbi:hypothetical protein C4901_03230 [Acidiferrobacter sp. SPIII_3]|nr:hypothetical protein C4901_03230 [Acidiferrobacter sp. SPIII_3]
MGMVLPVMGVVTTDAPPIMAAYAQGLSPHEPKHIAAKIDQKTAWVIEWDDPNSGRGIKWDSSQGRVHPRPPGIRARHGACMTMRILSQR